MAETTAVTTRPDADIAADIDHIITRYPPMRNDRHHVHYTVNDGLVTLSGHTRTSITHRYLVESIRQIPGVRMVDDAALYSDQVLRRDAGQITPNGVYANAEYGTLILTGRLPAGTTADELIEKAHSIPGVRSVQTNFIG